MAQCHFESSSTHLNPDDLFSSVQDEVPNAFESVYNNQTCHSYNNTLPATRRHATMTPHRQPDDLTSSSTSFEPVFDSPIHDRFSKPYPSTAAIEHSRPSTHQRKTAAMGLSSSHHTSQLAEAYFDRLFVAHPNAPPVPVRGSSFALQQLGAAIQRGSAIGPDNSISAAAAFEASLLPFQAASVIPTSAQMASLFRLPRSLQLASGLDIISDFGISEDDSARYTCTVPLLAYKEIDCARQYLEICSRHQGVGSVVEVGIVTLLDNQCTVEVLSTLSRKSATHTIFMFRQLTPGFFDGYTETYRPFVSTRDLLIMPIEPMPGKMQAVGLVPEMKSALAKSVCMGLTNHGDEVNRLIVAGRLDSVPPPRISDSDRGSKYQAVRNREDRGVVDANIEGLRILQAAQRYTNTELHEQIRASGSEVSYNSVTKRITNALKAQAKHTLKPGEDLNEKYEALRRNFNQARARNLKALDGASKKRGSDSHEEDIGTKRRKTLILSDESEEEAVESEEDEEEIVNQEVSNDGFTEVRRSARVRRNPTSHVTEEESFADDEEDLEQQDSVTESEDSDISEYDEDE